LDRINICSVVDLPDAQVALAKFVDDLSILAIERLLQELPSRFDPDVVERMSEDDIKRLAAETEETAIDRARCTQKRDLLEEGLRELKRFDNQQFLTRGTVPIHCKTVNIIISSLNHKTLTRNR
jgi:hypothetical protein